MNGATHRHSAFGLEVDSNRRLGGLPPGGDGAPAVTVVFDGERAPPPVRGAAHDGMLLRWEAGAGGPSWTMEVSAGGDRIVVSWTPGLSVPDIETVVETTGLAACLILRGVPLLHASSVDVDGRAVVSVGAAGLGKSTLAAAFVAGGHRLLADDIAALARRDGRIWVQPGGTRLRVHGAAASVLSRAHEELPRVFETEWLEDKRYTELSAAEGTYCHEPLPVAAICVLEARDAGGLRIERLAPSAALLALLGNTYGAHLTDGPPARRPAAVLGAARAGCAQHGGARPGRPDRPSRARGCSGRGTPRPVVGPSGRASAPSAGGSA